MIYLRSFVFPSEKDETDFLYPRDLTAEEIIRDERRNMDMRYYKGSCYPFNVLGDIGMRSMEFSPITILYGGNGCGKTTVLNVVAEKLGLARNSLFNTNTLFPNYLEYCKPDKVDEGIPRCSRVITSDDVFKVMLGRREYNKYFAEKSHEVETKQEVLAAAFLNDHRIRSMDDYEDWKERREAATKNKYDFVRKHVGEAQAEHSNGESALNYFVEKMDDPGLYLLDEPENSLSIENQIVLADYVEASAHYYDYQFIIATHSPIFLAMKNAKIYNMDEYPVQICEWTKLSGMRIWYEFFKKHSADFE